MTATTTVAINASTWTAVATGLTSVLIHAEDRLPFEFVNAAATPSPNSPASSGTRVGEVEGHAVSLTSITGNVYARSCSPAGGVLTVTG